MPPLSNLPPNADQDALGLNDVDVEQANLPVDTD